MYLSDITLDDLLRRVLEKLLKTKNRTSATRGGMSELTGVLLRLENPRARLSHSEKKGTVFSCLGEFLWYLSRKNELNFIQYYINHYKSESEDGKTIYGGYGPRLFNLRGVNQVKNVEELLRKSPGSRRAVIELFQAEDIVDKPTRRKEIPCTCTLQFLVRNQSLDLLTFMRSNDAFLGLPHDIFTFTMLQELLATSLGLRLGTYKHFVGSLHLYLEKFKDAKQYIAEGWQTVATAPMPAMPLDDPWGSIRKVMKLEKAIRLGNKIDQPILQPYWEDLVRLLQVYRYSNDRDAVAVRRIRTHMKSKCFDKYISKRQKVKNLLLKPGQLDLPYPEPQVTDDGEAK